MREQSKLRNVPPLSSIVRPLVLPLIMASFLPLNKRSEKRGVPSPCTLSGRFCTWWGGPLPLLALGRPNSSPIMWPRARMCDDVGSRCSLRKDRGGSGLGRAGEGKG